MVAPGTKVSAVQLDATKLAPLVNAALARHSVPPFVTSAPAA